MAILKSEIRNKFTTIPNSVVQAEDISDGDYRLLIYLYSLPDGWKINQGYLGQKMNCSRVNINKKISRIKQAGYLDVIRTRENNTDFIYVLKEKNVSVNDVSLRDVSSRNVSLSDTYINTNIINTKEINTELNIERKSAAKKFIKPTLEELKEYCTESSLSVDCQYFYDYYESNGWLVGKNKMKDWKATLRNWNRRNKEEKKENQKSIQEMLEEERKKNEQRRSS